MNRVGWSACLALLAAIAVSALALQTARAQAGDDHAAAEALVKQIEADGAHRSVVADALGQAKAALERAAGLRRAGDEAHARAADGLARECAETARDLARAADTEATAADLRRKAVEAQAQLERARTLVEEGITRTGRLRAELEEAERAAGSGRRAVEAHEGDPAPAKSGKPDKGKPASATPVKGKPASATPEKGKPASGTKASATGAKP